MSITNYNIPLKSSFTGPQNVQYFDDFTKAYPLTSNLPVTATSPFNAQATSSGTFSQASPASSGGIAVLSGAATTNASGVQVQNDHAGIIFASGGSYEASCRIQLSSGSLPDFVFGLMNQYGASGSMLNGAQSSTLLSNIATSHWTDGVAIYKAAAAAISPGTGFYGLNFLASASTAVTAAFGLASANFTILGIGVYMGAGANGGCLINFYQDGALLSSMTVATMTAVSLAPVIGFLSGSSAGTQSVALDWMMTVATR